jgi:orotate phosphoribosyltransferase
MDSMLDVMKLLEETEAHLQGHFLLSSGLHSDHYFQCARLLQYPDKAEAVGRELASRFEGEGIRAVVSPAMGGIVIGQETARGLGVRHVFGERGKDDQMTLRRGFELAPGERVLLVEDVVTTGKSILELKDVVEKTGAEVFAFASIVDRANNQVQFPKKWEALTKVKVNTWKPEECPLCKKGIAVVKPGSRKKV